jgi:hypothetical protein
MLLWLLIAVYDVISSLSANWFAADEKTSTLKAAVTFTLSKSL